ncbi:DUF2029 domain-containing protein [Pseudonocardiaceae bacterium YIM PH 21723]|nr:DUF2029 domain-containing protein [Pseudonocardiaceae bacterium YIM PH 21723]
MLLSLLGAVLMAKAFWAVPVDVQVYRAGGQAVLSGDWLYDRPVTEDLSFTYPPFAALLFVPLAWLTLPVTQALWVLLNSVTLIVVLRRSMRSPQWTHVLPLAGLLMLVEAVHTTVYIGQINLVLLALVLLDLLRPDGARGKGIGLGIAAGIKLTPLIFLLYLVITGRWRAAGTTCAAFATTVLAGFVLLPQSSRAYWLGGVFADASRVYPDQLSTHNQSLRGMLVRLAGAEQPAFLPWLLLSATVIAGTLWLARQVSARGDELLALSLIGLLAAAVSPWSWGHHWVWLVPLSVCLVRRLAQRPLSWWLLPTVLLPATFPWILAIADPPPNMPQRPIPADPVHFLLGNLYLAIFFATLVVVAERLHRAVRVDGETASPVRPGRSAR